MGGAHKGLLTVDGVPLISRAHDVLASQCEAVLVITFTPDVYRPVLPSMVDFVSDRRPGHGAPSGVHTALCEARDRGLDRACVLACDMPAITTKALAELQHAMLDGTRAPGAFYEAGGHLHPLAGWWGLEMLSAIEEALASGAGLQSVVRQTEALVLAGDTVMLANWNSPSDMG